MKLEDILDSRSFPQEEHLITIIMHTSSTVWKEHELGKRDIDAWLSNFKGEVFSERHERLMALWLLSHFTFYNQAEVQRLCQVVYKDLIHLIIANGSSLGKSPEDAVNDFFASANIVPCEQMSGSGGFVAYLFRQQNDLPINLFNYSAENVSNAVENIITIDDVTLTGKRGQMARFLRKHNSRLKSKKIYLLTLLSSESATQYLKSTFNIEVVTAIQMDNRDKCFNRQSDIFSSFPSLLTPVKRFAEHYGKKIGIVHPLGYADGQYTFGFFYNAPDNTLPIFWAQVNNWIPIVRRHHKLYRYTRLLHYERFV